MPPRRAQGTPRLWRSSGSSVSSVVASLSQSAQLQRIKADVTPLLDADGAHAGDTVRGALTVTLPDGFHVQSNKPRDPSLIADRAHVDAPAGVTVERNRVSRADRSQTERRRSAARRLRADALPIGVQLTVAPESRRVHRRARAAALSGV